MQFKNLIWYLSKGALDLAAQESAIAKKAFSESGPVQAQKMGWVKPFGGESFVLSAFDFELMHLVIEKRLLPNSVINDNLAEKIDQFESVEGYLPSRKIRQQMREDVTLDLLPKAFTKQTIIPVLNIPRSGLLFVGTGSATVADEVTAFLRESTSCLPITNPYTAIDARHRMTQWIAGEEVPERFSIGGDFKLEDADGAVVRASKVETTSSVVEASLDSGMLVDECSISFNELANLRVNGDLKVSGIKVLAEEPFDDAGDVTEIDKSIHELGVFVAWVVPFIQDLIAGLGGLDQALKASIGREAA